MFEESASASAIPSSLWASMNSWLTPTVLFVLLNLMIGTIALTSTSFSKQKQQQQNDPNQPRLARSPSVLQRLKSINFYSNHHRSQDTQTLKPNPQNSDSHFAQNLETHFFQQVSQENTQIFQQIRFQEASDLQMFQQTQTQMDFLQSNLNPESLKLSHEQIPQQTQPQIDFSLNNPNPETFNETHEEKVEEDDELRSMDEIYSNLRGGHFSRTKSDTEPSSGKIPTKLPEKMRKSASMKSPFGHFEEEDIVETRRPATVRERGVAKVTDGDEEVDAKADDFINKFKQQLKLQRLDSIIRYKDMIGRGSGK